MEYSREVTHDSRLNLLMGSKRSSFFKDKRGLMIQTEGSLEGKTRVTLVTGELDS
jgi:hypothetical protein